MSKLEKTCLFIFTLVGVWASIHVGIAADDWPEYVTLQMNLAAILGLWSGDFAPYQALIDFGDRYYGMGFHFFSNALADVVNWFLPDTYPYSPLASKMIFWHASILLAFVGSGILVRSILMKLTKDALIASLGMVAYLLWPYLLGHGLMNVKDIPFLFAWLLCSNFAFLVLISIEGGESSHTFKKYIIWLGIATGWLISIRVLGVLIFIQYFVLLGIYFFLSRNQSNIFKCISLTSILLFIGVFTLTLFLLYPILWHNPLEFLNAIQYMSHHPWQGETLTNGQLLAPKNQTYFYILMWLLVKLPIITILGLILTPFYLLKNSLEEQKSTAYPQFGFNGIAYSLLLILLLLTFMKVGLYNELRQILFIFPLLFILGITALYYFNRKILIFLLILSIGSFAVDDIALYPYQYTYLNEVVRHLNIQDRFERDYFGISAGKTAMLANENLVNRDRVCIYASPEHLWTFVLNPLQYQCLEKYVDFAKIKNPFLVYWITKGDSKKLPLPSCRLIHEEVRNLPISQSRLVMGQLFYCNPALQ